MGVSFQIDDSEFIAKLNKHVKDVEVKARDAVEYAGREAVKFATSYTGNSKPGVNPGDGPRRTHPGNWSDVSSNLVNSIKVGKVKVTGHDISAEFGVLQDINGSMEYAAILDERDGYSVLAGADVEANKALKGRTKQILT